MSGEKMSNGTSADKDPLCNSVEEEISEEQKAYAEKFKTEGNLKFKQGQFNEATHLYTEAIKSNPHHAVYWANRSVSHLRSEYPGAALEDASRSIKLDPTYIKAYYRRASAYLVLNKYKDALRDLESVKRAKPNDKDCVNKYNACHKEYQRRQFLKAIHSTHVPITSKIRPEDIIVETGYAGPYLPYDEKTLQPYITEKFVEELVQHLKKVKKLHKKYAMQILILMMNILKQQPSMVKLQIPDNAQLIVCGDVHGQYYDMLSIFDRAGKPSATKWYLFNGDFVDRGSLSVECALTLFAYKILYPHSFHLARGNHEADVLNQTYGFKGEVTAKYNDQMYELFTEVFNYLPLAHLINSKVLVMHGGIPTDKNTTLQDLESVDRFRQPPDQGFMCELLWNDPLNPLEAPDIDIKNSKRGVGYEFGPSVTTNFCDNNGLFYIIRSHEVKDEGYEITHGGKVITIFSAPNYCDQVGNKGAFITIHGDDPKLTPNFTQFRPAYRPAGVNTSAMQYASPMFRMLGN